VGRPPRLITLEGVTRLAGGRCVGPGDVEIGGVTHDSRRVRPGDLFVAIPGFERDGHDFVGAAAGAGAAAALVEREGPWPLPVAVVDDVRSAIGPVAHRIHGDPAADLVVVGVTGSNGKTTTTFLAAAVLQALCGKTAILGTLGLRRGGDVVETGLTTPEAPDLARLLAGLVEDGVEAVAMEVSSHALELGRVGGIRFAAGAFTNLSAEHLDFHETMEAYGAAKLAFFRRLAELDVFAAVNADDPWGERFRQAGPVTTWRYSLQDPSAEVFAERIASEPDGTRIVVRTPAGRFETRLRLPGRFNVANALAAAAIGAGLGLEPSAIGEALGGVERVPGRFEVYRGGGVTAIVDYAHTPLAFDKILGTIRETGPNRLVCIFGCGGERDRDKRPEMARIVGERADVAYVTIDNPRREPIEQIMEDTLAGFEGTNVRWERIDDRAVAILRAVREARAGDVVCLLGKGDEPYQWIGDEKRPWSDRDEVRRALAEREAGA